MKEDFASSIMAVIVYYAVTVSFAVHNKELKILLN